MSSTLLLIPTQHERGILLDAWKSGGNSDPIDPQLCGFGPIVSAARTTALIQQYRPQHVCLVGIAGSLAPKAVVGQAYMFKRVACYGVGVGAGDDFRPATSIGWSQWDDPPIHDVLAAIAVDTHSIAGQLLSTCSASANLADAERKRATFPKAVAEDMEAFSVATACLLAGVPFSCIRGISNIAGDRDKDNWRIEESLTSAANVFLSIQQQLRSR